MKVSANASNVKSAFRPRDYRRLANFAQPMQILLKTYRTRFHGDNTGSNPVGDTNKTNNLQVKATRKHFGGVANW